MRQGPLLPFSTIPVIQQIGSIGNVWNITIAYHGHCQFAPIHWSDPAQRSTCPLSQNPKQVYSICKLLTRNTVFVLGFCSDRVSSRTSYSYQYTDIWCLKRRLILKNRCRRKHKTKSIQLILEEIASAIYRPIYIYDLSEIWKFGMNLWISSWIGLWNYTCDSNSGTDSTESFSRTDYTKIRWNADDRTLYCTYIYIHI